MKAKEFTVSVQWGGGHHYFLKTYDTEQEAILAAASHAERLSAQKTSKRGARPTVFAWRKAYTANSGGS